MQQLGRRVAIYRKKCHLSQAELSDRVNALGAELADALPCDMTRHRISRIERGLTIPSLPEIIAFCLILNVDLNCIVHNICDIPSKKESALSELEQIMNKMDEFKRDEFVKLTGVIAHHFKDEINFNRPST